MKYINYKILLICALALFLASCGGAINATIGGTVTGLSGNTTLTLQDNGGDNLAVSANGTFTFATQLSAGTTYVVTILTQPTGETCVIENGVGEVEQSIGNVSSIAIICNETISTSNSVLGTVSGLPVGATVVLTNEGTNSVTVTGTSASSVSFVFPPQAAGSPYDIAIQSVTGATCSNSSTNFTNTSGIIPTGSGSIPLVGLTCF
jgi:hypothetical protein